MKTFVDSIITDEVSDFDPDLEVELDEEQADEFCRCDHFQVPTT